MARTRNFDEEQVLDKAMRLFWKQGYEATSIQDLVACTGVNRASLYNTFGGKSQLFQVVLDRYRMTVVNPRLKSIRQSIQGRAAIEQFFLDLINDKDNFKYGCLMTNSCLELACFDPVTAAKVLENLGTIEEVFYRALLKETDQSLDEQSRCRRAAQFLVNTLQGLRVTTKAGCDKLFLHAVVSIALGAVH